MVTKQALDRGPLPGVDTGGMNQAEYGNAMDLTNDDIIAALNAVVVLSGMPELTAHLGALVGGSGIVPDNSTIGDAVKFLDVVQALQAGYVSAAGDPAAGDTVLVAIAKLHGKILQLDQAVVLVGTPWDGVAFLDGATDGRDGGPIQRGDTFRAVGVAADARFNHVGGVVSVEDGDQVVALVDGPSGNTPAEWLFQSNTPDLLSFAAIAAAPTPAAVIDTKYHASYNLAAGTEDVFGLPPLANPGKTIELVNLDGSRILVTPDGADTIVNHPAGIYVTETVGDHLRIEATATGWNITTPLVNAGRLGLVTLTADPGGPIGVPFNLSNAEGDLGSDIDVVGNIIKLKAGKRYRLTHVVSRANAGGTNELSWSFNDVNAAQYLGVEATVMGNAVGAIGASSMAMAIIEPVADLDVNIVTTKLIGGVTFSANGGGAGTVVTIEVIPSALLVPAGTLIADELAVWQGGWSEQDGAAGFTFNAPVSAQSGDQSKINTTGGGGNIVLTDGLFEVTVQLTDKTDIAASSVDVVVSGPFFHRLELGSGISSLRGTSLDRLVDARTAPQTLNIARTGSTGNGNCVGVITVKEVPSHSAIKGGDTPVAQSIGAFRRRDIGDTMELWFEVQSLLDDDEVIPFPVAFPTAPSMYDVQVTMQARAANNSASISVRAITATGITVNRGDSTQNAHDPYVSVYVIGPKP